jgi:Ca2+-binding EF-hand superfamily protein
MKTPLALVALFCSCTLMSFADEASSKARLEQLFKNFDANGDGGITLDEYKAGMVGQMAPERVATVFKQKDRNSDGKLTLAELLYHPEEPVKKDSPKKDDKTTPKK